MYMYTSILCFQFHGTLYMCVCPIIYQYYMYMYITFFLFIFQTEEHQWMRVSNHLQQCPGNGCSVDMCLYIRQLCEHDMDDCDIGKWSLQDTVIVIKCLLNFSYSAILYTKRMKFCYLR